MLSPEKSHYEMCSMDPVRDSRDSRDSRDRRANVAVKKMADLITSDSQWKNAAPLRLMLHTRLRSHNYCCPILEVLRC